MSAGDCRVSENNYVENNSVLYNSLMKISKRNKKQRPFRTSTPIPDSENNSTSSFSDPVTDFFYQSWKNGLHSDFEKSICDVTSDEQSQWDQDQWDQDQWNQDQWNQDQWNQDQLNQNQLNQNQWNQNQWNQNQWNHDQWYQQPHTVLQPVCYALPVYYSYVYVQCNQLVGYRSDGTFGILPTYWTWNFG